MYREDVAIGMGVCTAWDRGGIEGLEMDWEVEGMEERPVAKDRWGWCVGTEVRRSESVFLHLRRVSCGDR